MECEIRLFDIETGKPCAVAVHYQGDAGVDLHCPKDIEVPAASMSFKIPLGVRVEGYLHGKDLRIPMLLAPRSSTGSRTPLRLCNSIGLIDAGYDGELIAFVDNLSKKPFEIERGDRYFQLIPHPVFLSGASKKERGSKGFGSTSTANEKKKEESNIILDD